MLINKGNKYSKFSFLIILLHFAIISTLEVTYAYCTYVKKML